MRGSEEIREAVRVCEAVGEECEGVRGDQEGVDVKGKKGKGRRM